MVEQYGKICDFFIIILMNFQNIWLIQDYDLDFFVLLF